MGHKIRVLLAYKNFAAWAGISHIGLGVAATTDAALLRKHGVDVEVVPCRHNVDLVDAIRDSKRPVTHVIISAPWLSAFDLNAMLEAFPKIQFSVIAHSNVGFLQADPAGVRLLRQYVALSQEHKNFRVGGNSKRFVRWFSEAYDVNGLLLPNLYEVHNRTKIWNGVGPIQIGTFGAIRPQKNVMTAAAAAILIGKKLELPVEFNLSTGREDGGGGVILNAVRQMTGHLPGFHLVERHWTDWHDFRRVVRQMDLMIQVSYTESFNMVTADGVAEGIPSVVSSAIDWAPRSWIADADDAEDVARVGVRLLRNECDSDFDGFYALRRHTEKALLLWLEYLYLGV